MGAIDESSGYSLRVQGLFGAWAAKPPQRMTVYKQNSMLVHNSILLLGVAAEDGWVLSEIMRLLDQHDSASLPSIPLGCIACCSTSIASSTAR